MGRASALYSKAVAVPASENKGSRTVAHLSPTSSKAFLIEPAEIMLPSKCKPKG